MTFSHDCLGQGLCSLHQKGMVESNTQVPRPQGNTGTAHKECSVQQTHTPSSFPFVPKQAYTIVSVDDTQFVPQHSLSAMRPVQPHSRHRPCVAAEACRLQATAMKQNGRCGEHYRQAAASHQRQNPNMRLMFVQASSCKLPRLHTRRDRWLFCKLQLIRVN